MINIITGDINSGKTTKLLQIFNASEPGTGDGFISIKSFLNNEFCGYSIKRISNNEKTVLASLQNRYKDDFITSFSFGQFVFSIESFHFGERIILELLADERIKDIYLDEIGPIELQGKGFYSSFKKVLKSDKNIYVCIRTSCLQKTIEKFALTTYTLIKT